jgi:hypothetical protein
LHPGYEQVRPRFEVGEACGSFWGRLPFIDVEQASAGDAFLHHHYSDEHPGVLYPSEIEMWRMRKPGGREPRSSAQGRGGLGSAGFQVDPLADPQDQVLGRARLALQPDDLLELALELGPLEARRAVTQVVGQAGRLTPIELTVEVVLDLGQHLVAANL